MSSSPPVIYTHVEPHFPFGPEQITDANQFDIDLDDGELGFVLLPDYVTKAKTCFGETALAPFDVGYWRGLNRVVWAGGRSSWRDWLDRLANFAGRPNADAAAKAPTSMFGLQPLFEAQEGFAIGPRAAFELYALMSPYRQALTFLQHPGEEDRVVFESNYHEFLALLSLTAVTRGVMLVPG